MWLPFRRELDDAFRANRSLPLKMLLAALVSCLITAVTLGTLALRRNQSPSSLLFCVLLVLGAAPVGAVAVLCLTLKDTVRRSMLRGKRVSPLLRTYFGLGIWSVVLWVPTAIILTAIIGFAVSMMFI